LISPISGLDLQAGHAGDWVRRQGRDTVPVKLAALAAQYDLRPVESVLSDS
jgi:hypothetical protein